MNSINSNEIAGMVRETSDGGELSVFEVPPAIQYCNHFAKTEKAVACSRLLNSVPLRKTESARKPIPYDLFAIQQRADRD